MHNKLVMVDDALAIFGGRNLGDEYYDADPDTNMVDIDLLCGGAILADAARSFEEYWGHVLAVPIEHCMNRKHAADASEADVQRALETSRAERPEVFARLASYQSAPNLAQQLDEMIWGQAKLVWDPPGKALTKGEPPFQQLMVSQLVEEATALQSELVMASAYLVPGKAGCAWLSGAVERGAKVSVLTNSLAANDVPPMHAGYVRWRDSMLGAGIQLWELRSDPQPGGRYNLARTSSSLHTKTAVWDRRHVVLGPLNLDPRSVLWNTENALLIESPELGEAIRALLLEGMTPDNSFDVRKAGPQNKLRWHYRERGKERYLDAEGGGALRRIVARVVGWLRVDHLL